MANVPGGSADAQNFTPIPDGFYKVKAIEVNTDRRTNDGVNEMWGLKLEIIAGEHRGRFLFDNITFSEAGFQRVRIVMSRLAGLDTEQDTDLHPGLFIGKSCYVEVETKPYNKNGVVKQQNKIPFAGYHSLEDEEIAAKVDEEMPF